MWKLSYKCGAMLAANKWRYSHCPRPLLTNSLLLNHPLSGRVIRLWGTCFNIIKFVCCQLNLHKLDTGSEARKAATCATENVGKNAGKIEKKSMKIGIENT